MGLGKVRWYKTDLEGFAMSSGTLHLRGPLEELAKEFEEGLADGECFLSQKKECCREEGNSHF